MPLSSSRFPWQFNRLSIRNKLMVLFMLMGTSVLLVSEGFFIRHEWTRLHENLHNQLLPIAQILAFQSQAAMRFDDDYSAQELLSSLKKHSSIVSAYIYKAEGSIFAAYHKNSKQQQVQAQRREQLLKNLKTHPSDFYFQLVDGEAWIQLPIWSDKEVLGYIQLIDDQSGFQQSIKEFFWLILFVIMGSLLLAFVIAAQLPKIIAAPIVALKQLMLQVSQESAYHLRAEKYHDDELGELVDGFNAMLEEVEQRDRTLAGYSERLEQDVARRTRQLRNSVLALETERDRAEAANRAKSAFLAAMSHEIRTPMNGVLGILSLLRNTRLEAQQQRYVQMGYHSAEALLAIINDILDFSKIEAGQLHLEIIPFDLHELIREILEIFDEPIRNKGLKMHPELDAQLAPAYRGDPTRLRQVLFNLLSNAIKFTQQGDLYLTLKVLDTHYLNFRVEDTGIGIPKEKQTHIFEAFAQADNSTTRQYGGTGLGLTICKQLIKLMGGEIGVHSQPGEGATFWFTLPLFVASPEEQRTLRQQSRLASDNLPTLAQGTPYQILLAEDNPVNQEVAKAELESLGCYVSTANNGREAFDFYQKNVFDLVLMDCEMPELDGFQTTQVIRRYEHQRPCKKHIPIIALTANAVVGTRQACIQAGMDGYLSKPFSREQLLETLRCHLTAATPAVAPATPRTLMALNREKIDKLRKLQPQMLEKMVALYMEHSSMQMQQLAAAFAEQDLEQIARLSHSLKSASLNVGATQFSTRCKAIEIRSKQGNLPETACFEELQENYQQVVAALRAEIAAA